MAVSNGENVSAFAPSVYFGNQIPALIRRCNSGATCAVTSTHITIILESLPKPGDDTLGDSKFLESVPHNAKAHYNYANYKKDVGDKFLAIEHYRIALSDNSSSSPVVPNQTPGQERMSTS
ncbi:hypothetical protein TNCV_494531 [Trichonephila clavipes]|nr:hypothetical protein TNCV_494531 [Trichonephila clavipes]